MMNTFKNKRNKYIHPTADVQSKNVGSDTYIWQFSIVLAGAEIGNNCNINSHVFIENDVTIGDNVTVKSGVQIWDGVSIADNVFIGPNVTFTNDILPRSKQYPDKFEITEIHKGASIGANATIIAGNNIGENAMIGAGAVVTKTIGNNELWVGNPAKHVGYISMKGEILNMEFISKRTGKKHGLDGGYLKKNND